MYNQHATPNWPTSSASESFVVSYMTTYPVFFFGMAFPFTSTITFPCPPLQSCGPQESCTERNVFLQVDWRDCEGWEMDTESEAAEIPFVVYAVSVASPFASERRDRPGVATTPAPCRNDSWKRKGGEKCHQWNKSHVIYYCIQHKTEQEWHTQTGLLCGVGCRWCRAVDPPSDCQRGPAPAFFEPAPHPDLHPHHHPPM